jgi:zinc/manganese transport system substrate-binding protein
MRRRLLMASLALAPTFARANSAIRVMATFSLLADMTRRIGGELASVDFLVPIDGDAHVYQPKSADLRALNGAALLVENGMGLEGWMRRLTEAAGFKGARAIASTGVTPRQMHGGADPHAWQDPRNGVKYARNIQAGLTAAAPERARQFATYADAYVSEIEQTDRWIAEQFASIPPNRRRIVTTHDAFGYYGVRYEIEFLAAQGIATDAEPSAKSIAALIDQIKRDNVRAVFIENMTDDRLAKMLTRETRAVIGGTVYSDALSTPNGPAGTYLAMLRHNTSLFAKAMRGQAV